MGSLRPSGGFPSTHLPSSLFGGISPRGSRGTGLCVEWIDESLEDAVSPAFPRLYDRLGFASRRPRIVGISVRSLRMHPSLDSSPGHVLPLTLQKIILAEAG